MIFPERVKIVEVGPRDGLQNESVTVPAEIKVQLVELLADAGLPVIEVGAFVSPRWVPQMATSSDVFTQISKRAGISYPMLVPNLKGLELAHAAGVQEIALFAATTETFSQTNTNCSIAESIERFNAVIDAALALDMKVRGYISCVLGCPYEGEVSADIVLMLAEKMFARGCYEVSLGDTIGVGTAGAATSAGREARARAAGGATGRSFPRYLWPGAGQYTCGYAMRDQRYRQFGGGSGRLSLCEGCDRQCGHRRRCLHA